MVALCTAHPLQAISWRTAAACCAGVVALGVCTYYFLNRTSTFTQEHAPAFTQEQIEKQFIDFSNLIEKSKRDMYCNVEINKMIKSLEQDDTSKKLLCCALRYKEPNGETFETLLTLASQSKNHVTKLRFEQLYKLYEIS